MAFSFEKQFFIAIIEAPSLPPGSKVEISPTLLKRYCAYMDLKKAMLNYIFLLFVISIIFIVVCLGYFVAEIINLIVPNFQPLNIQFIMMLNYP